MNAETLASLRSFTCYPVGMSRVSLGGGRSLLLSAALCLGMVGCAAQHDDSLRLSEELGHARADAAWQQSRAAELESRVARLEQHATEGAHVRSAQEDKVLVRLDQLLAINESLLAARSAAPLSDVAAASPPPDAVAATAPTAKPSPGVSPMRDIAAASNTPPVLSTASASQASAVSPEQQLRAFVEALRGRPGRRHGTLTREQEDALRVLLRTERALDADNPYPASFY